MRVGGGVREWGRVPASEPCPACQPPCARCSRPCRPCPGGVHYAVLAILVHDPGVDVAVFLGVPLVIGVPLLLGVPVVLVVRLLRHDVEGAVRLRLDDGVRVLVDQSPFTVACGLLARGLFLALSPPFFPSGVGVPLMVACGLLARGVLLALLPPCFASGGGLPDGVALLLRGVLLLVGVLASGSPARLALAVVCLVERCIVAVVVTVVPWLVQLPWLWRAMFLLGGYRDPLLLHVEVHLVRLLHVGVCRWCGEGDLSRL